MTRKPKGSGSEPKAEEGPLLADVPEQAHEDAAG